MQADIPVVTIDGPSGTGKGTLCSRISRWLDWNLLDSGALYRILALLAQQQQVPVADAAGVAALARDLNVRFMAADDEPVKVILDGKDVGSRIRQEDCGNAASSLAEHGIVRAAILGWQRSFQQPPGLVADGRDMGTVVFPGAGLKVFLTANPQVRAKRRYKQLNVKGINVKFADLVGSIAERDKRDKQRIHSPLKPADGAVVVDTSDSGIDDVFTQVAAIIEKRFDLSAIRS
ncbi:MAG: (d)CMP kinase [Gammaproteobacteria bacterium]|nr:(d)CMP kinase [Gammaproteobacteria bacterium]